MNGMVEDEIKYEMKSKPLDTRDHKLIQLRKNKEIVSTKIE